ncbi:MAG: TolC family protein [Cyclobacteriaceae bacterium]|nr:TolC family protein [Cyclobacteriaceae bacterium]
MKTLRILFFIISTSILAVRSYGQEAEILRYTLDQCLKYAYEHNEQIIIANLEMAAAKAQTGQYMSSGFPQVDASASVNKNFILRRVFVPANTFDPSAPADEVLELQFGTPYTGEMGVNLSQMVFNGSYFVGLKASKTYQELSAKDHIKSKIDVTEMVTKAYYTVLVNQLSLETLQSNYQRLDSLVRETEIMNKNGFAELIDLNRTKVEFNNLKTALNNAQMALDISVSLLKFQMGMPVENNLEIAEKLADLNFNVKEELEMGYSYTGRIEYSRLQTSQDLAQLEMRNNKSQYLPKIDLIFSWGLNAGVLNFSDLAELNNRMVWPDYQVGGLTFKLPIFDGLYKSKLIQQNKVKIKQLEYQRQMLENSIRMEVDQLRKTLIMNLDLLKNQEENAKLAESVYNQTKIKYQEGVGTNLEVVTADTAYKQAQSNYFSALYDALISHVNYQKALGILKIE